MFEDGDHGAYRTTSPCGDLASRHAGRGVDAAHGIVAQVHLTLRLAELVGGALLVRVGDALGEFGTVLAGEQPAPVAVAVGVIGEARVAGE